MKGIGPSHRRTLEAVISLRAELGRGPSVRELARALGERHHWPTQKRLRTLRLAGLVRWDPSAPWSLEAVPQAGRQTPADMRGTELALAWAEEVLDGPDSEDD